jgi:hypothetical protein
MFKQKIEEIGENESLLDLKRRPLEAVEGAKHCIWRLLVPKKMRNDFQAI